MLLVRKVSRDRRDIRLTQYQPTLFGRMLGLKTRNTVHQFNGRHGGWLIKGTFSGSDEIEINARETVVIQGVNCDVLIVIKDRQWHDDLQVIVTDPSEGIQGECSIFPPLEEQWLVKQMRKRQPKLKVA